MPLFLLVFLLDVEFPPPGLEHTNVSLDTKSLPQRRCI